MPAHEISATALGGWSAADFLALATCPVCHGTLAVADETELSCSDCAGTYSALPFAWNLTPPLTERISGAWPTWEQLQANGSVAYAADPEHNLGLGDNSVSLAFGRFSRLSGLVLDVGCGPQEWPAHFDVAQPGTVFVGVDPLVGDAPGRYLRVRALAEHLPFRRLFDQVLFVGSIDHLVDPRQALREARRVLTPGGVISVCVGEKADDAPPPTVSHDWYANLRRPAGAQDVFHFKRMGESEVVHIFSTTGLEIEEHVVESVDAFRTRHFFRLVPDGRDPDR